jgi:Tfp pilus assembly major pilin PilA
MSYRKFWESHNGEIPKDKNGRSFEIHHVDGNNSNNVIENLKCVSIQEHFDIHFSQGDYAACLKIGQRMEISPEEFSKLSKLAQNKNIKNGTHNFLESDFQSKIQKRLIKEGRHIFQTDLTIQSRAGKKGILHVKLNGWSKEAIEKRVKTRKEQNSYSRDMSSCHTKEAIAKRVESRKNNDKKQDISYLHSKETSIKRELTKKLNRIKKLGNNSQ